MVYIVSVFNIFNLIPEELKQGAKTLQSFFASKLFMGNYDRGWSSLY